MAPKPDQLFKEKFSKFLQEKTENDDSDDEYDAEENISGRLGGNLNFLGIPHDEDLDVPHEGGISRGFGGKTGGSLGGISFGGRGGLGGLGGRTGGSLGGLGGLGGRGASSSRGGGNNMVPRGGLGGLGRGKPSKIAGLDSVSSSDNVRLSTLTRNVGVESGATADVPNDSVENISKALGDIAKGTTALQKEVAAFISDSQQKNVEAFKEILHFVHGLEDRTVVHFKELSRFSAPRNLHNAGVENSDEKPVDEALEALISNIDKTLKDKSKDTVYIVSSENSSVDISELSKLLGKNNVQLVDDVRSLCDKIMSDTPDPTPAATSLPVQVANITPSSSPSKVFPPLRSPAMK